MAQTKAKEMIRGFIDTIPVGLSTSMYGVVYGVLAYNAGLSFIEAVAMSAIVFAGASQMAAAQMVAFGSSPMSIIITVLIINLRHFLLAASMSSPLRHESTKMRLVNAFFLTDESYAVAYSHFQTSPPTGWYFLGSGFNIYLLWGLSGVIGFFFGNIIPVQLSYVLEFAFVAAFIGILVPMVKDFPTLVTVIVSGVISILGSQLIPGKWYILIAGIGASLAGYLVYRLGTKSEGAMPKEEFDYE